MLEPMYDWCTLTMHMTSRHTHCHYYTAAYFMYKIISAIWIYKRIISTMDDLGAITYNQLICVVTNFILFTDISKYSH